MKLQVVHFLVESTLFHLIDSDPNKTLPNSFQNSNIRNFGLQYSSNTYRRYKLNKVKGVVQAFINNYFPKN